MLGLSFGGVSRKARQFEYQPRYYDAQQEAREARRRAILGQQYVEDDNSHKPGMLIRQGRLRRMQHAQRTQKSSRSTLLRAAIFVILVFGALWLLTNTMGVFF